jgi:hypothetical protein
MILDFADFWAPSPYYVVGACVVFQAVASEDIWMVQSLFVVFVLLLCLYICRTAPWY